MSGVKKDSKTNLDDRIRKLTQWMFQSKYLAVFAVRRGMSKKGYVVDYVELLHSTLLPVACFILRFSTG
jgi:hypothetical protein